MSVQITTSLVDQFRNNVLQTAQQLESRLRKAVLNEMVTGENAFVEQIKPTGMVEVTTRHADTPLIDTPHARRRLSMRSFRWADLIDREDRVRSLIDPTNPYARNAAAAAGRQIDDVIIAALGGPAETGKDGATTVALPSTQKVAAGSSGLTVAKLRGARQILEQNEAVGPMDQLWIAVTAEQVNDLLGDASVTSADFNTVRALVQGEIDTFVGFKFVRAERLPKSGTDRSCYAWATSGTMLGIGAEPQARIDERPDKGYATQVFFSLSVGATRLEEEKVVEIACAEAA